MSKSPPRRNLGVELGMLPIGTAFTSLIELCKFWIVSDLIIKS